MIFILAKNADIARITARLAGLQPKDWIYIDKSERMQGYRQAALWLTESCTEHQFYRQVIEIALERDFYFFDVHEVLRHHLIRELGGKVG